MNFFPGHKKRIIVALILAALLSGSGISFAGNDPAFVRTQLEKVDKIWPGQRLMLYVTLYTTTSFSGSTRFELPRVSGMLIMENEDRPVLGSEKIDTVSYISKRYEIALFPLRSGSLSLPDFGVEFGFRGEDGNVAERSFQVQGQEINVLVIPGADPQRPVITTTNFQLTDKWNPEQGEMKVGDAFTRTVTMTADDLPGMAFPPLEIKKIDGLGIYTRQPRVEDQMQRGEFTGRRTEIITYVCERKGTFIIPQTTVQWWNPKTGDLQDVTLESMTFNVAANPLLEKEGSAAASQVDSAGFPWKWIALILFFIFLAVLLLFLQRRKKQGSALHHADREKELFEQFRRAAESQDAGATMGALLQWLDHSGLTGTAGTLARFSELADDPQLDKQIELLEAVLYVADKGGKWSGGEFYGAVQRARKKLKQQYSTVEKGSLPPLNP
jgi:hypothetical protein